MLTVDFGRAPAGLTLWKVTITGVAGVCTGCTSDTVFTGNGSVRNEETKRTGHQIKCHRRQIGHLRHACLSSAWTDVCLAWPERHKHSWSDPACIHLLLSVKLPPHRVCVKLKDYLLRRLNRWRQQRDKEITGQIQWDSWFRRFCWHFFWRLNKMPTVYSHFFMSVS